MLRHDRCMRPKPLAAGGRNFVAFKHNLYFNFREREESQSVVTHSNHTILYDAYLSVWFLSADSICSHREFLKRITEPEGWFLQILFAGVKLPFPLPPSNEVSSAFPVARENSSKDRSLDPTPGKLWFTTFLEIRLSCGPVRAGPLVDLLAWLVEPISAGAAQTLNYTASKQIGAARFSFVK